MVRQQVDETKSEVPQGTPGARALWAMEAASRRARESGGSTEEIQLPLPPGETHPGLHRHMALPAKPPWRHDDAERDDRGRDGEPASGPHRAAGRLDRWLVTAIGVVAVLLLASGIALAVSAGGGGIPQTLPTVPATGSHVTSQAPPPTHSPAPPPPGSTSTPAAPPVAPAGGAAPVISSLQPSSGSAGQAVQVTGANLMSSNGQIVASVGGQTAPTSCPSQTTCTVTVPAGAAAPGPVPVTITTAAGVSNVLTFTYG